MKFNLFKTWNFLSVLCVMLLFSASLLAQTTQNISGVVNDQSGEAIIGASVQVAGTTVGTITDLDGLFTIDCSPQAKLNVSFIGYKSQTIAVGNKRDLKIVLEEDSKVLDEVVVVGYGVQRKSDLTGAVSSVKMGDAVKSMPVANVTDALQGRLAGVSIVSTSGAPNSESVIRVRGVNSFSADLGPLVVIDGFIGGGLSSLNPSDILSIEVLKDASATAIYGSRGANGVILVTTKNPESGKVKVEYSGYVNFKTSYKLPETLSPVQMAELANDYGREFNKTQGNAPVEYYNVDQVQAFARGEGGYNYIDNIFNDVALQHVHELSVSGGNEKTKFLFSGSYNSNDGIVKNSNSERVNYRLKLDTDVLKWLKVGINFWGDYSQSQGPRFSQYRGVLIEGLTFPTTIAPRNSEGKYNNQNLTSPQYNPMGHVEQIDSDGYSYNSFLQGYVDVTIAKGLTFRMLQGFTFGNRLSMGTNGPESYAAWQNSITDSQVKVKPTKNWINTNILSYVREFNKNHRINATLVFEQQESNSFESAVYGKGLSSPDVGYNNIAFASRISGTGDRETTTLLSGLARVNYAMFNRYMITASFRRDGSSRLAYDNAWDNFASASLAWDVKQESFMQNVEVMDQFKVRFGYGETGNQAVAPYSAYSLYKAERDANQNLNILFDRIGNPNLRWERTAQYNGGIDLGFFNNRLTANIDVYHKLSKDVLLMVDVPTFTGFPKALRNSANILNKGVEITIGGDPFVGKNFSWNTNLTLSKNATVVKALADGMEYMTLGKDYEQQFYRYIKGHKIGTIWGYKFEGLWKTEELANAPAGTEAGSYKYANLDGSADGLITDSDQTIIGNGQPTFNWGWSNSFGFKNFDASLFIVGFHGFDIYNYTRQARRGLTPNPEMLDRWTLENPNSNIAGFSVKNDNAKPISSEFIEKGDFLKVKSITLGYSLPKKALEKIGFSKVRFYASIQNPFVITSYSGIDPEVAIKNPLQPGVDWGYYPNGRNYLIGLNVAF